MIELIAQDAVDRLKTITEFSNQVGLSVGGRDVDPQLENVPKPAAWVLYSGSTNTDDRVDGSCVIPIRHEFEVLFIAENGGQSHLKTNVFPVIEKIIGAINGQAGPTGTKYWRYESNYIDLLESDRLIYNFRFSIIAMI